MTARTAGFVTRAAAGLRPPRSYSRNITPGQGGVAVHYGGPPVRIKDHAGCLRTWRAWQAFHMDSHGWADIAYTMGVCDHGYVLAGRGAGVRTAAQGTNAGNDDYYAVVWLGGDTETPSPEALQALEWAVRELRSHGGAGDRVRPHKAFHTTSCPGLTLTSKAGVLDGAPIAAASSPVVIVHKPEPVPDQPATPKGPPPVIIVLHPDGRQFVCDANQAHHIDQAERAVLIAAAVPYVDKAKATDAQRVAFLTARGVA